MNAYTENVIKVLNQVKGFEKITKEDCTMKRLGGMTNIVHLVETQDIDLIVRIPGKGTEDYINRTFEYNNAMAAWRAGVSAEILWADVKKGVMVSKAINKIEKSQIKKLITTDTIDNSKKIGKSTKIEIISLAPMISEAMKRIANSTSVSSLFK